MGIITCSKAPSGRPVIACTNGAVAGCGSVALSKRSNSTFHRLRSGTCLQCSKRCNFQMWEQLVAACCSAQHLQQARRPRGWIGFVNSHIS